MKKILVTLIAVLLILVGYANISFAEETPQIEIKMKEVSVGNPNELQVELSLGKFTNVKENAMLAFETKINFDEEVFENVRVTGVNGWRVTYTPNTNRIVGDPVAGVENTAIAIITLKIKEGAETENTIINLENFLLADDDENEYTDDNLLVETQVKWQGTSTEQGEEEGEPSTGGETNKEQLPGQNTDATIAKTASLPKAGSTIVIALIVVFGFILISGLLSGKGYIGYIKDTHKQIKK